jgi:hypothetical protein
MWLGTASTHTRGFLPTYKHTRGEPTVEVRFMSLDPIHGNPNQAWLTGRWDQEAAAGGSGWRTTTPRVSSMRGFPEEKWTDSSARSEEEGAAGGGWGAAGLPPVAMAGGKATARKSARSPREHHWREGSFCKRVPWLRAVRISVPPVRQAGAPTCQRPRGQHHTIPPVRDGTWPPLLPDGADAHGVSFSACSDGEIPTPNSCCAAIVVKTGNVGEGKRCFGDFLLADC